MLLPESPAVLEHPLLDGFTIDRHQPFLTSHNLSYLTLRNFEEVRASTTSQHDDLYPSFDDTELTAVESATRRLSMQTQATTAIESRASISKRVSCDTSQSPDDPIQTKRSSDSTLDAESIVTILKTVCDASVQVLEYVDLDDRSTQSQFSRGRMYQKQQQEH
jgi:hypothetical protein